MILGPSICAVMVHINLASIIMIEGQMIIVLIGHKDHLQVDLYTM